VSKDRRAYQAARYLAHQEERASYRNARREEARAYAAARREADPEKARATYRAYYAEHQEQRRADVAARRATAEGTARTALHNASRKFGETVPFDVWFAVWSGACFGCGTTPARGVDHVIPHSRGGRNVASNLQPACWPCNASKGAKTLEEQDDD